MSQPVSPRRILIVRLSALGDVVMASGLITALRRRHPGAQISWLCEPASLPLLRHNPHLHQVLVWPRPHWRQLWREHRYLTLWRELRRFHAMLRAQGFDWALDAQGLLKSGVCAWMTHAPRRVSIMAREGSRWLVHERLVPPQGSDIMSSEYRHLAAYLGAREDDFQLDLAVGGAAREQARAVLQQAGATGRVALLCAFTTRPQKHWMEPYWLELATALRRHGYTPVLLGGPGDHEAAARMAAANPDLINLAGKLPLDESVAAVSLGSLLIGVDTGLTHMGTALRVPTVALFGSTRPYLRTGTATTRVLYDALPCSPCRRHPTCNGRFDCMRQLTVARVLEAALALVAACPEGSARP
jgi:heptosyltransferase-1